VRLYVLEGFQLTPNHSVLIFGYLNIVTICDALYAHARTLMKRKQHVKEFGAFKNKKRIIITNYNFGF